MVVNHGKVLTMDWDYVRRDIEMVVLEGNRYGAITKVILETDYLDHSETIAQLCSVCEASGAHFVKTSTGFGFIKTPEGFFSYQGATEENIKLMRSVCSPAVGVKASGGVRDLQAVEKFLDLGCARIGTSSTQAIMAEFLKRSGGEPVKSGAENALAELNEY
jgi:deoxyribose-phosphate aldolase